MALSWAVLDPSWPHVEDDDDDDDDDDGDDDDHDHIDDHGDRGGEKPPKSIRMS